MQHIIDNHPDMATALLAGEKLKELILPGQQDDKAGALAALLLQLKLELPFDRVVTIGTVLIPILLVTLVFTKNFAGKGGRTGRVVSQWLLNETTGAERCQPALALAAGDSGHCLRATCARKAAAAPRRGGQNSGVAVLAGPSRG